MRILAMDTCLGACSAAIWQEGTVIARDWRAMPRGHAEALLPMVEALRAETGLDYASFDRLAVSIGPGSFAGVRVGLAAARGICAARGLPLAGVGTLELLAASVQETERFAIALDARNNQIYFQAFAKGDALCPPELLGLTQAAERVAQIQGVAHLFGSGAGLLTPLCGAGVQAAQLDLLPDAAILAGLAATREPQAAETVAPLYLRAPDAKLPSGAP